MSVVKFSAHFEEIFGRLGSSLKSQNAVNLMISKILLKRGNEEKVSRFFFNAGYIISHA